TEEDWDKQLAVNVKGTFFCYKYAGAQMIAQGRGGRIIGASSLAGKQGSAIMAAYSATKFAVRSLTQSAGTFGNLKVWNDKIFNSHLEAMALGQHGITVNAYAPGPIETPMLQFLDSENAALTKGKTGDLMGLLRQKSLVGFNGSPADIASLVSYLASKEAGFVTGQSNNSEESDTSDSEDASEVELTHDAEVELQNQSNPTDQDVFVVHAILLQFVPSELVNVILHAAQYWPCISVENARYTAVKACYSTGNNAAAYYLITPVIPTKYPHLKVEMVKFNLKSCDQGWGGDANNHGQLLGLMALIIDSLILEIF
ncbi:hypothetical protein C0993_011279, partial [Termitomyces sp. T159_Od127]